MKTQIFGRYLSGAGRAVGALVVMAATAASEGQAQTGTRTSISGISSVTEHIRDSLQRAKRADRFHHDTRPKPRSPGQ